ncbi:hypothetical protein Bca4012_004128 [Brassica carinata]
MVLRQAQNSIGYLSPLIELRQISFRSWRRVPLLKRGILLLSQNKLDLCLVCWRKNLLQDIILGQLDYVKHITGVDRHESRFPLLHGSNEKKTNGDLIFLMAEFAGTYIIICLFLSLHAARKMAKKAEQLMKVPLLRLGLQLRQHREYCQGKCHNHKVEQALLKDEAFQKLVNFFQSCLEDHHFVHMLEPFLKIITESSRINKTLDRLRCL